jgi:hypothetical protein
MIPDLSFHLIKTVLVPHHPIVAQASLRLQAEDFPPLLGLRHRQMIVHIGSCMDGETPVVIVAIFLLQIFIYGACVAIFLRRSFFINRS